MFSNLRRKIVRVMQNGWEPFELVVALLLVLAGISYIIVVPDPLSVAALLPPFMRVIWGIAVFFGGLFTLAGNFTHRQSIRRAGLVLMGTTMLVYAMANITVYGLFTLFLAVTLAISIFLASMIAYVRSFVKRE